MKRFKFIFPSILLTFLLTSCSLFPPSKSTNSAFSQFTETLYTQEVSSSTINLHYSLENPEDYGIEEIPITFGSFQQDTSSAMAYIENISNALYQFPYNSLSEENQLTYDTLSYYLDIARDGIAYSLYEEPLSPNTGTHAQLPILLSEFSFHDTDDIENYLSLLETLPDYFSSLSLFEKEKSAQGLFMSDASADLILEQCNAFLSLGENNYLISTFQDRLSKCNFLSDSMRQTYQSQNRKLIEESVIPAYESLVQSLESLKGSGTNTNGLCYFSDGKNYYQYLIKSQVGTKRDISDIKKLIQNQITSDFIDCQEILSQYPNIFTESVAISKTPENILTSLRKDICYSFPTPADVTVEVKYVPTALQEHLSPAFYLIPPIDNYDKNTIYINPSHTVNDIYLFTTLAHEGYPGHLYQTTYFADTDPDPIRTLISFTGYVEGWATYAEMCSYYISPLEKNQATLLQKNNSMILGLYAMADVGIHYDGWTIDDAVEFFSSYGIADETVITEIYQYIVGDPANYLSYYLGYLEILELKKDWDGSQMEFHKWLLDLGPVPFAIIDK